MQLVERWHFFQTVGFHRVMAPHPLNENEEDAGTQVVGAYLSAPLR